MRLRITRELVEAALIRSHWSCCKHMMSMAVWFQADSVYWVAALLVKHQERMTTGQLNQMLDAVRKSVGEDALILALQEYCPLLATGNVTPAVYEHSEAEDEE